MRIYKVGVFSTQFVHYCFLLFCWFFFSFLIFLRHSFFHLWFCCLVFLTKCAFSYSVGSFLLRCFFNFSSVDMADVRAFCACLYSLLLIFNPIPLPVPIIVWHTRPIVHYAYVNWFWSDADIVINNRWHTCIVYMCYNVHAFLHCTWVCLRLDMLPVKERHRK